MSTVLAIEAATERCSVALSVDGGVLERSHDVPREHARFLLPFVDALLAEAGLPLSQLDALAVGRGPGSFTGVRAAIATVQGLAWGSGLPVVAESTLRVLAASALRASGADRCVALLDARMNEVYVCAYAAGPRPEPMMNEQLLPPEQVGAPAAWQAQPGWCAAGSGLVYADRLPAEITGAALPGGSGLHPDAGDLAALAEAALAAGQVITDPAGLQPVYLRNQVVHTGS